MHARDRAEFDLLLSQVFLTYSKQPTQILCDVFFESLENYSIAECVAAFKFYIKKSDSGQFPPSVSQIVQILDGSDDEKFEKSFSLVLDALKNAPSYTKIIFENCETHATIRDLGGFGVFVESSFEKLAWIKKDFKNVFKIYLNKKNFQYPQYFFIGSANHATIDNRLACFGNREKCLRVFDNASGPSLTLMNLIDESDRRLAITQKRLTIAQDDQK